MPDYHDRDIYQKMLWALFTTEFVWSVHNDDNRIEDAYELRIRYDYDTGEYCGKDDAVSVLEVLIAMAIRCENELMYDPEYGDRTPEWFWIMISNLRLTYFTDDRFDQQEFDKIMKVFLGRTYDTDGFGGAFYIHNFRGDMRKIELWHQLNLYLEEEFRL